MKKVTLFLLAIAIVLSAFSAQAGFITGAISFSGGYETDTGPDHLATATEITSFSGVTITTTGAGTNDLAPLVSGTTLTMPGFSFNPFSSPAQFWTVTLGSTTLSFDLTTLTITSQDSEELTMRGEGLAHITDYKSTPGNWILTANELGQTLSFSASSMATPIPEPATMLLFGGGLLGLAGIARKKFRKES